MRFIFPIASVLFGRYCFNPQTIRQKLKLVQSTACIENTASDQHLAQTHKIPKNVS